MEPEPTCALTPEQAAEVLLHLKRANTPGSALVITKSIPPYFKCSECSMVFCKYSAFVSHMERYHGVKNLHKQQSTTHYRSWWRDSSSKQL